MADEDPIRLGDEVIEGWEAPESLPFEIYKAFVKHDFPGGRRNGQTFGVFDSTIAWSGTLVGDRAEDRAHTFEFLCGKDDDLLELRWRSYYRKGVITRFKPDYSHAGQVEYEIEFECLEGMDHGTTAKSASSEAQVQWSFQQAQEQFASDTKSFELQQFQKPVEDYQKLVEENIKQSNGSVQNIDPQFRLTMAVQGANLQALIRPYMSASWGSVTNASAGQLISYLGVVENILRDTDRQFMLYPVQDPVFPKIASEIYKDASLWTIIAEENRDLIGKYDTQAKGYFVLRIPLNPQKKATTETLYR